MRVAAIPTSRIVHCCSTIGIQSAHVLTCWHRFSVFLTIENVLTKNDCWVLTYLAAEVSGRVGVGVLARGTPEMD